MKNIVTACFLLISLSMFAQEKTTTPSTESQPSKRNAATSSKTKVTETPVSPYDVNDKYMGRKDEFLNSMIISELPLDFPVYDKLWSVTEYNAVVDAYYMLHMDILKERVKQKIQYQIDQQQTK